MICFPKSPVLFFDPGHRYVHISESDQYRWHHYKILFFLCQPVADRIEKDVTGIPNCLGNIVKSVTARINPAFWFVTDVIINSGTPDLVGCRNHVFCQTGCCGNQLKGGTGCGLLLRRIIEQRRRFIMLQDAKYSESTPLASLLLLYPG